MLKFKLVVFLFVLKLALKETYQELEKILAYDLVTLDEEKKVLNLLEYIEKALKKEYGLSPELPVKAAFAAAELLITVGEYYKNTSEIDDLAMYLEVAAKKVLKAHTDLHFKHHLKQ